MAVTYGFYNALNHDRLYDAIQMSSIFDGIIRDGIFSTIGDTMIVTAPEDGMYVNVGSGRAWFNHTWTLNDTAYPIEAEQAEVVLDRIDAVILEVNSSAEVRANSIKFLKGTPSSNPVKPTLTHNAEVNQYALAYVRIRAGQTTIFQSDIENAVGTDETPFITGVLQQVSIETLLKQWEAEFNTYFTNFQNTSTTEFNNWLATKVSEYTAWFAQMQTDMDSNFNEFDAWFQRMKDQLSQDAAGHLQAQIDALSEAAKKGSVVTVTTTDPTLFGKNVTISKTGFDPVTSSFNSAGVAYFETVPMVGDVTIEATNGTLTAHGFLNIPYFGRYNTTLEFWEAILDISTDIESLYNRQITVKKNNSTVGTTTFDSTGHATFSVHSVGTYNVSATDSLSTTYEVDVDVTEETTYIVEFIDAIDGATVKPTDDITTWLKCANIEDPSVTTLADVLANRSLFETLIANSNACNYMARSTTWALAEGLVPIMTSNTAPKGTVTASSNCGSSNSFPSNGFATGTDYYYAFDKNNNTLIGYNKENQKDLYIEYQFENDVTIKKAYVSCSTWKTSNKIELQLQHWDNNSSSWVTDKTFIATGYEKTDYHQYTFQYDIPVITNKVRIYSPTNKTSGISIFINEVQFYGRESKSEDNTNIIHSAANDTIYMMKDGSPSVLTTTDSNGVGTLDFTQFDDGVTYTLYSSVAKDPNNLSNDYSKNIRITKSKYGCTTEAYLIPDGAIYWYGYKSSNYQKGNTIQINLASGSISENTNNITLTYNEQTTGVGEIGCALTKTMDISGCNKMCGIASAYTYNPNQNEGKGYHLTATPLTKINYSGEYFFYTGTTPSTMAAISFNQDGTLEKQETDISNYNSGSIGIVLVVNGGPYTSTFYALWLE